MYQRNSDYTKVVDNEVITKKFGDNLRRFRLLKKLSQSALGEKLGFDKSYISVLENGKKNPTLTTIGKLAKAMGVQVQSLIK